MNSATIGSSSVMRTTAPTEQPTLRAAADELRHDWVVLGDEDARSDRAQERGSPSWRAEEGIAAWPTEFREL